MEDTMTTAHVDDMKIMYELDGSVYVFLAFFGLHDARLDTMSAMQHLEKNGLATASSHVHSNTLLVFHILATLMQYAALLRSCAYFTVNQPSARLGHYSSRPLSLSPDLDLVGDFIQDIGKDKAI